MINTVLLRRLSLVLTAAATTVAVAAAPALAAGPSNSRMGQHWPSTERSNAYGSQATPTGVLGIDVSSYQGDLSWKKQAKKGKTFAYIKATEGTSYRNPFFAAQYTKSYQAGFVRGAYHYANPAGKSGTKQARYFFAHGGAWSADSQTLPGALDIEYGRKVCYGISKKKMRKWVGDFLEEYKRLSGRDAVIYTTADWWNRCTGNTKKFNKTNPLWVARWGTKTPGKLSGGWAKATFWQYSDSPIDQNWFNGSAKELVDFANNVTRTPPPNPAGATS